MSLKRVLLHGGITDRTDVILCLLCDRYFLVLRHAIQIKTGKAARVCHVLHKNPAQLGSYGVHAVRRVEDRDGHTVFVFDNTDHIDCHTFQHTGKIIIILKRDT